MELNLKRTVLTEASTIGQLSIGGKFQCFTLEDRIRPPGVKVAGKTAIPKGRYEIQVTHSPRFGKLMPLLVDVPGFAGIRIHSGNKAADTEGCILVGETQGKDFIGNSRKAYKALFAKLLEASGRNEPIWLTIE